MVSSDRLQNALLAAAAAAAGFFITFSQSHAVPVGRWALIGFSVAVFLIAAVPIALDPVTELKSKLLYKKLLVVTGLLTGYLTIGSAIDGSTKSEVTDFRGQVILLVLGLAVAAASIAYFGKPTRQQRIEAAGTLALSVLAALVFWLVNLDDINAVGLLGAYFVLIAVNWGVSAASPK